jgi:hypothetical protein
MVGGSSNGLVWRRMAATQGGDMAASICAHAVLWCGGFGEEGDRD